MENAPKGKEQKHVMLWQIRIDVHFSEGFIFSLERCLGFWFYEYVLSNLL